LKRQINALKSIISAQFATRSSQKASMIPEFLAQAASKDKNREETGNVVENQGLSDEIASRLQPAGPQW
jgi:hypothetical protein